VYFYFDQFTGELLHRRDLTNRTAGDLAMPWFGRLHVGAFGGPAIKVLWLILGLAPTLLFVTGAIMWWNRVVVPRARAAWGHRPARQPTESAHAQAGLRIKGSSRG
jgi:uncharacterized iron-regulated membrane protein